MDPNLIKKGVGVLFFGIAIGAFGRHGLEPRISAHQLEIFEIGVKYQFVGAFALLAVAALQTWLKPNLAKLSSNLLLYGTIIFAGSLYILAITDVKILGAITPIGGLCMLAGLAVLFFAPLPSKA